MAEVDVSELMEDPDFADEFKLVFQWSDVSTKGENMCVEEVRDIVGVRQPTGKNTIRRLPASLRKENVVSFWITGSFPTTEKCRYPTLVEYRESRYKVRLVIDWENYGFGWSEAVCVEEKIA